MKAVDRFSMSLLSIFGVVQVEAKSDRSKIDETTLPQARDSKFDVRKDVSLRGTSIIAPERTVEPELKETGQQFSLRERA